MSIFSTYSQSLTNGFVWDDYDFIVNWQALRIFPSNISDLLQGELPDTHDHAYRPLRSLYYGLAFNIWGENPLGYHLQAIVVHWLVVILIYMFTKRVTKNPILALVASLWFGLHPSNSEAVNWITASFDTIGNLWFFLALYHYVRFRQSHNRIAYYLSLTFATLAFYSYELTLILPLILILYDVFIYQKRPLNWQIYIPFWVSNAGYWVMRFFVLELASDKPALFSRLIDNLLIVIHLLDHYLRLTFWNLNPTVNHLIRPDMTAFFYADYNFQSPPQIPRLSDPDVMMSLLIVLSLVGVSYFLRKKLPLVTFLILSFLITLLPVSQIFPRAIIFSERYLYLGIGLVAVFGAQLIKPVVRNKSILGIVLMTAILIVFGQTTYVRAFDWSNNISLWTASTQTTPQSTTMYRNLGDAYHQAGQYQQAIKFGLKALEINPNNLPVYANIGASYVETNQFDLAIQMYTTVTQNQPNDAYAFIKLGDIYFVQAEYSQAREFYIKALHRPSQYQAYIQNKLQVITSLDQE